MRAGPARLGFLYDTFSSSAIDFGEYAVEYLKRVSPHLAVLLGYRVLEGDEASLVTELHWSPSPRVTVRLGNRLGIVSSALSATTNSVDYQPGVGMVLRLGER